MKLSCKVQTIIVTCLAVIQLMGLQILSVNLHLKLNCFWHRKKNVGFFELAMGLAWRGIWYCILIKLYHSCSVSQLGQSQQLNVPKSCDVWSLYPLTSVMLKAVFHNFPWLMNYEFIYMVKGMWPKKAKYKVYIFTWDSIGIKMC